MERLSFGHSNAIASRLSGVDEYVMDIRATLLLAHVPRLMGYTDMPDEARKGRILKTLDELVKEIQWASAQLKLDIEPIHVERRIRHRAGLLIAELGDVRPRGLIGYGPLEPSLARTIGTSVQSIATLLDQL